MEKTWLMGACLGPFFLDLADVVYQWSFGLWFVQRPRGFPWPSARSILQPGVDSSAGSPRKWRRHGCPGLKQTLGSQHVLHQDA